MSEDYKKTHVLNIPFQLTEHNFTEEIFSEDLTTALQLFKRRIYYVTSLLSHSKEISCSEAELQAQSKQLVEKYVELRGCQTALYRMFQRFLCRIRETIRFIFTSVIRSKPNILVFVKKIELYLSKLTHNHQYSETLNTILQEIPQQYKRLILNENSPAPLLSMRALPDEAPALSIVTPPKKPKEADKVVKNMAKYICLEVDVDYIRKIHFDFLDPAKRFEANSQIHGRNKHILSEINSYVKEYSRYTKSSSQSMAVTCRPRLLATIDLEVGAEGSRAIRTATTRNSGGLIRRRSNFNYATISFRDFTESLSQNESFNVFYNKKMQERQENTVKITNIIMGCEPRREVVNVKRRDFYKKTQEHLKLKYKYMNRRDSCGKSKSLLNPELNAHNYQTKPKVASLV